MGVVGTLRQKARTLAIGLLSLRKLGAGLQPGIRFVCYHGVCADETAALEAQLRYMKALGRFVGLGEATDLMAAQSPIDEALFAVTFDDGLSSTYRHAWPVLERLGIPFAVFVITNEVGKPNYMAWDEIAEMARSPLVTIGSHTVNHRNLRALSADEVRAELGDSKARLESVLARRCDHFCCPWGRPGRDFAVDRDPQIALEVGYRSFLTCKRGLTHTGDRLPVVKRDTLHMHSSRAELKYFLY